MLLTTIQLLTLNPPPQPLYISREKWWNGVKGSYGHSALFIHQEATHSRNAAEGNCCLGFYGNQFFGWTDKEMDRQPWPSSMFTYDEDSSGISWLMQYVDTDTNIFNDNKTFLQTYIGHINDTDKIPQEEREIIIEKLFFNFGNIQVIYID